MRNRWRGKLLAAANGVPSIVITQEDNDEEQNQGERPLTTANGIPLMFITQEDDDDDDDDEK